MGCECPGIVEERTCIGPFAVQESWLRLSRSSARGIENLNAWLTTVVARVSLNMLHSCWTRREGPLDVHVPDPVVSRADRINPEQATLLADSVGLALLVILETLDPDSGSPSCCTTCSRCASTRSLQSSTVPRPRCGSSRVVQRRRVQASAFVPDADRSRPREVVEAFLAAARAGDFEGLVAVLDPDVVLRADRGTLHVAAAHAP
jgi:RNA polymerase sigma-70 factor (ECF subfamily)